MIKTTMTTTIMMTMTKTNTNKDKDDNDTDKYTEMAHFFVGGSIIIIYT